MGPQGLKYYQRSSDETRVQCIHIMTERMIMPVVIMQENNIQGKVLSPGKTEMLEPKLVITASRGAIYRATNLGMTQGEVHIVDDGRKIGSIHMKAIVGNPARSIMSDKR